MLVQQPALPVRPAPRGPGSVALLAYGPSLDDYVLLARQLGARHAVADEIWSVNALSDVLVCDRVFHMDSVYIQEIRAAAEPASNIARMLARMRVHPGPIYTSDPHHPAYPGLVAYPLEDVLNDLGEPYFNSTVAYAVAFAIHIGVQSLRLFGLDFTYPRSHDAEKGRACVEFWLGVAMARGIEIQVAERSSLMDMVTKRPLYGFGELGSLDAEATQDESGAWRVRYVRRRALPSAAAIEAAYDHSKHPSPHLARQGDHR